MGQKDFQQLFLIKKHIKKKFIKTKVISCKTIREKNGIAYSTRNSMLNKKQLLIASKVYKYLKNKKFLFKKKDQNINFFNFKKELIKYGVKKIDYIDLLYLTNLNKVKNKKINFRIFIAYYLGKIRLIDNV